MPRASPYMACTLLAAPFAHDPTQGDGSATPVSGVLVVAERGGTFRQRTWPRHGRRWPQGSL